MTAPHASATGAEPGSDGRDQMRNEDQMREPMTEARRERIAAFYIQAGVDQNHPSRDAFALADVVPDLCEALRIATDALRKIECNDRLDAYYAMRALGAIEGPSLTPARAHDAHQQQRGEGG